MFIGKILIVNLTYGRQKTEQKVFNRNYIVFIFYNFIIQLLKLKFKNLIPKYLFNFHGKRSHHLTFQM